MAGRGHVANGVQIVAVFEAAKGLLVLLAGFGLLALIHENLHEAAAQLVRHLHINPARHYPRIFIDAIDHVTDARLWVLAFSALLYSVVRFIESFGLWRHRQWAEWFGVLTGGIYIPLELFELMRGVTWPKAAILIVNSVIVGYLTYELYRSRFGTRHSRI